MKSPWSQPDNISAEKFAEVVEDSQIICKSCNCVYISNDEYDVKTKSENEVVVCCITATEFEEVEISIDKDVDVVSNLDVAEVNYENDRLLTCRMLIKIINFSSVKTTKKYLCKKSP